MLTHLFLLRARQ
jgi:hypothetical protein